MSQTFYLASSVHNITQTRDLADYLEGQRGYSWANGHNWTLYSEADAPFGSPKAALLVAADVSAAVAADVFILLRTDVVSHGAHAELGARLVTGKTAHLILQGSADHLFYYHQCVIRHQTIQEFLEFTQPGRTPQDRRLF